MLSEKQLTNDEFRDVILHSGFAPMKGEEDKGHVFWSNDWERRVEIYLRGGNKLKYLIDWIVQFNVNETRKYASELGRQTLIVEIKRLLGIQ